MSYQETLVPVEQTLIPASHPWARLPLVGLIAFVAGLTLWMTAGDFGSRRGLAAWLVAFTFFLTVALGCLYFVLIHTAMQGGWGVVVRRLAETAAATLPAFALLFLPLALALSRLYPWSGVGGSADALLRWKQPYLNETFFLIRAGTYLAVWSAAAVWFLRLSRRQDREPGRELAARLRRWSGPLLIPVGLAQTFAAFDWLMSLEPRWYSTIFGVYFFAGALVAGFAFLALGTVLLTRAGLVRGAIGAEHFHDLGKLLFAFTAFWAYIAFSQYLLIWYGNLPEETIWYRERLAGPWLSVSVVVALGHFVLPFFFLLPRAAKRNPAALAAAAAWLLLMHLVDVYWLVVPSLHARVVPGLADLGALVAVGGAFLAVFGFLLRQRPLLPLGDPRLVESLAFENV